MCGINGIWNFTGQNVENDQIENMNDMLIHRGPDEGNQILLNNIGLGHRRLSIIDVENGKQPMANDDNTIFITYNGEVYNYQKLQAILKERG